MSQEDKFVIDNYQSEHVSSITYGKKLKPYGKFMILEVSRYMINSNAKVHDEAKHETLKKVIGVLPKLNMSNIDKEFAKVEKELKVHSPEGIMSSLFYIYQPSSTSNQLIYQLFLTFGKVRRMESISSWYDNFRLNGLCQGYNLVMWKRYDRDGLYTVERNPQPINKSITGINFHDIQRIFVGALRTFIIVNGYYQDDFMNGKVGTVEYNQAYDRYFINEIKPSTNVNSIRIIGDENTNENKDSSSDDILQSFYGGYEQRIDITNGSNDWLYSTGYALRKGGTFDRSQCIVNGAANAACSFRATEALLIYMEAEYMLTKNLNAGHTLEYWRIVREAAGFTGTAVDPQTTIAATDMQQEKLDWGAYSAGQLLDDPILYNIRRERRCELMGEAKRWDDLIRWRALDQLMTEPYHIEGFHLWNSDMTHYYGFQPESYDGSGNAVVSSPDLSEYLRPYEKNMTANNLYRNGYTWHLAHYLQPLPTEEMRLTSPDQLSVDQSTLYQNPYWPPEPGLAAER